LKRYRGILALLLTLTVLLAAGCGDGPGGGREESGSDAEELIRTAEGCMAVGDRFSALLMDETAAYFYGFAGSTLGSLRLAAERILWLKGEGEDFGSLARGSRYTDWDALGELCFACPYPYYFEGLIWDVQGMEEEAETAYGRASVMTNFPEDGLDFYSMKDMSTAELYALRDRLREAEEKLYGVYTPVLYGYSRSEFAFSAEYLCLDACELMDGGSYKEALIPARYAVRQNPRSEENWVVAVTAALYADDPYQAAVWLQEGLAYFPESRALGDYLKALQTLSEKGEGAV